METKYELVGIEGGAIHLKRVGDKHNINKTDVVILPCFIDTLFEMLDLGCLTGEAEKLARRIR